MTEHSFGKYIVVRSQRYQKRIGGPDMDRMSVKCCLSKVEG